MEIKLTITSRATLRISTATTKLRVISCSVGSVPLPVVDSPGKQHDSKINYYE